MRALLAARSQQQVGDRAIDLDFAASSCLRILANGSCGGSRHAEHGETGRPAAAPHFLFFPVLNQAPDRTLLLLATLSVTTVATRQAVTDTRTTSRCPPPKARARSTTPRDLPTHTHTTSHVAALPDPSRDHTHTRDDHSLTHSASQTHLLLTSYTSSPHPTPSSCSYPARSMLRRPCTVHQSTPSHIPRQNATPPAPHQQLPPRPLGRRRHPTTGIARAQNSAQRTGCLYVGPNQRNRFEDADAKTAEPLSRFVTDSSHGERFLLSCDIISTHYAGPDRTQARPIESRHHTRIRVLIARVLLGSHTFAPYSHAAKSHLL